MSDYRFVYKNYTDLSWYELQAIMDYMNSNDLKTLTSIIEHGNPSRNMRRFIADIIAKKLTRPPDKKPSTFNRNCQIYIEIDKLLRDDPKLKLTSNSTKGGAALIVGKRFEVNEDTAIKAYSEIKKVVKNSPDFLKIRTITRTATKAYLTVIETLSNS